MSLENNQQGFTRHTLKAMEDSIGYDAVATIIPGDKDFMDGCRKRNHIELVANVDGDRIVSSLEIPSFIVPYEHLAEKVVRNLQYRIMHEAFAKDVIDI